MEKKTKNQISRRKKLAKRQERRRNRQSLGLNAFGKEIFEGWHSVKYDPNLRFEPIEDLQKYTYDYLAEHQLDGIRLSIGTDGVSYVNRSEEAAVGKASTLKLLTVICFRKPGKGAHIILRREKQVFPYRISTADKLNGEVNKTYEIAMYFRDVIGVKPIIHLDLNDNPIHESYNVYKTIHGFFESLGFEVEYKPDAACASSAADYYI